MVEFLVKNIFRFRIVLSALLIVTTLVCSYFLTKIHVDNDTFKAIPASLKEKIDYEKLKEEFSASISVLFLAEFYTGTLEEKIDSLRSWEGQLKLFDGVEAVTNLNTVQIPVRGGFLGMNSDYLISRKQQLSPDELRNRIKENREFTQFFISKDESVLGMIIEVSPNVNRTILFRGITAFTDKINASDVVNLYFTSEVAVSYFTDLLMRHDFRILLPICFIVIFLLLYRVFRKVRYVVVALLVNIVALIWTFGIMGMSGAPFSVVTAVIPVILFPIGVADAIHILKSYSLKIVEFQGDIKQSLIATFKEQLTPCLLTSLTTFAGFASFSFSPILWTRIFGIYTGIAVIFAYIFNVLLLPLFLSYEQKQYKTGTRVISKEEEYLNKFWSFLESISLRSNKWIIFLPVFLVAFVIGFQKVRVESNPVAMLPENSTLRMSDKFIEQYFGGTRFFSAVVTRNNEKLISLQHWETVDKISSYIETIHGVGKVTTIVPLISKVSMMLSGERISKPALSMVTSTSSLFGKSYTGYINTFLNKERTSTRITIACKNDLSVEPLEIAKNIELFVRDSCQGWSVMVSGPAILTDAMSKLLIKTQISSLITTFLPVMLCLILFFRSIRTGIFAIIPIIFATAFVYASMGLLGVTINLVTVIIMNTCIGIGIDYSIHFISGYIYLRKQGINRIETLSETIRGKGTPILLNTVIVGIGFLILSFSGFPPVRDFGILVFISMLVSAFFSIVFLIVLIRYFGLGKVNNHV